MPGICCSTCVPETGSRISSPSRPTSCCPDVLTQHPAPRASAAIDAVEFDVVGGIGDDVLAHYLVRDRRPGASLRCGTGPGMTACTTNDRNIRDLGGTGAPDPGRHLSLIHISEPTRRTPISYAVFCLKKK